MPSPLARRPALACSLALVAALACAHEEQRPQARDPSPPTLDAERDRTRRCMTLAEALYGATYPRQVIALSAGSPRMDADDESLAPLLACLVRARNEGERWPDALVRSLAHGHAAAVWSSRLSDDERVARLERERVRPEVTHYWRARIAADDDDARTQLLLALERAPRFAPASLALALSFVDAGRPDDATALLANVPEAARPDVQAYVRAAGALAAGERHQAAALLEALARGEIAATAPDGPDALALRSEALPDPAPLLCEVGRAHVAAGERADALRVYRLAACFSELTALYLDEGDAFSALLTSFWASPTAHVRALEAAGAHGLLRRRIEEAARRCEALLGGARCEEHRARLATLESASPDDGSNAASLSDDEPVRRALGVILHDDETALLEGPPPDAATVEVVDVVVGARGDRILVHALQPSEARAGLPDATRPGLALVEKTPQGWRATRFTKEMALSPGGA